MLRILQIIASVDPRTGGPVEALISQNQALKAHARMDVLCLDAPGAPFLETTPMRTIAIGPLHRRAPRSRIMSLEALPRVTRWLRESAHDYDAIFVNGLWNVASIAASLVLPFKRVPYFVLTHGMLDPWFRRTYPVKHWAKQIAWLVFEGRLLSRARAVLFTSAEESRLAAGQFIGYRYKSEVIPFGIADAPAGSPTQTAAFRAAVPSLSQKPYLLFLGRIHPKKGCDLLIDAFAAIYRDYPTIDLVIAGPDPLGWGAQLRASARLAGCADRVHWPGMIEGEVKWGALRGAYATILPSHQENFGIVVAEALACSSPVLITDKVNIWREIQDAGAGLTAADDAASVATQLRTLLAMPQDTYSRMREACKVCFDARFEATQMGRALLSLLSRAHA